MVEIAISVAAKIAEFLVAPVARPFSYLWNYKTNLENLKNEVKKLEAKRDTVERIIKVGEESLPDVKLWQENVKKIIDEASEVGEDDHQQASMQCFKGLSCTKLMKRYQHSKKAMKLKAAVGVLEEAGKFEKVSYSTIPEQRCLQPTEGYQTFDSRMSILKDIIYALSDSGVNMVGIYGMGGVGKTTLAKEVAREAGQKNGLSLFDKIIFVEVSQSPNIEEIQREVAFNLGLPLFPKEMPLSGRVNKLCDRLKKEEKILLILDNIWGRIDFEKIGIPIENDRRGLKLLLTTRSCDVLTNQMDSRCNFEVKALNKADAWSLFTSIIGTFIDDPDLKSIACEVAEECGGMPIAIVTIAKALKGHGQDEWSNALEELKNPSSKSLEGIAKEVYTSIKLSYDYLENEELKETFLLCSRMRHIYNASIQDLFRYGLGLGLFENFNTMEAALCNVYVSVNKLKAASLLLDVPKSESAFDPPTGERFDMHDVICDVAKSIANALTLIDVAKPQFWTNETTLRNCTSITLHNIDELPEDLELVCPQLKLLYMKLKDSSLRIPDNFFTMMLGLQVLHLIEINLQPLPTSISCLLDLQTLCLDRCELGDITFIGSLNKLKILSFCDSNIEKLPKEMCRLTKLRLLDLTDCSKLRVIPPNVMSNLKKLEALYMSNTSVRWEVGRPNIERSNVSIDELKHLRYLTMLEIHIPDAKMSKGLLSQKLEKYKIFIGDKWEAWQWSSPSKTSRMLKLSLNTNADENIFRYLKGIEELELGELPGATNLFDALDRNGFPTLKHLNVDSNSHCSCIVESCDALPLLESLHVGQMKVLEKICNRPLGANSFLRLRTIRVSKCHKLNNIFSSSAVTILPQLQEIQVSFCENIEEIFAIRGQDDANNTEVVHEIEFSQLRILRLEHLSRLKSFCCKVKTDSPLQLTSDTQPREIFSEEEMDICTLLFDHKVAFPNLQTLRISYIHVEKIWHNLPPKISSCVQNLTELSIFGCGNLKELFSSSMVVTEESRDEEMRDTILFPKLNYLRIENLEKLITLWSGYYIEFPTLKEFQIESCPQLDAFIFDDKVRVPSLEIMKIRYMHNLKMISHNQPDGDSFLKLKSLEVEECDKLLTLFPSNIRGRLLSLQYLDVGECQSLKYLFAASNNVAHDDYSPKFLFPKLISFELWILPELRSFYPGRHTVEGPVLKTLKLWDCFIHYTDEEGQMQMQQPLFFVEQAFPCLEQLRLVGKNVKMMWQGQVLESLFEKLKILEVEDDDSAGLPLCFIQRFQNLEKLSLSFSSYKEIFSNGEDQTQAATPARIKTLHLSQLDDLKYMWKQNCKLDLILQNLEALNIWNCDNLINVMPPSASFQNLTVIEVLSCSSLISIGTSSATKSLVQLTQMSIWRCKNIIEVVGNHGDVTEDEIIFPKLKSLSLKDLQSLTSFCSWNVTLQLPSLEELIVDDCPRMKIFSQGVLTTQTLRRVKIGYESFELSQDVDINKAIQQFQEKVELFGSVRRSLVSRTTPENNNNNNIESTHNNHTPPPPFAGTAEKINSCIRKSKVFSKPFSPPVKMAPPIRWRKGELIGCGAFGRVYMGMNLDSSELLAVKQVLIAANGASKEKAQAHVKELEEEVKLLKDLSHPNIVRYLGTVREEESLNILLEFVPGGSISSLLGKFGPFPEAVVRAYTKQLLLGLEYLHNHGIMHGDIKGANILVDNKGCIKLADFGASKQVVELATISGAKSMKVTPYWMAPEVILQTGHSCSADIWSVGCTVIEMATGKPPWSQQYQEVGALFYIGTTKSPPPIPEHLSVEAKDFLLKCLQKEPNLRSTASELLKHPFVTGEHGGETHSVLPASVMEISEIPSPSVAANFEGFQSSTCRDSSDLCNLGSLSCSTVITEKVAGSRHVWVSSKSNDDMCQLDKDDLMADDVKLHSGLMPNDLDKSYNPMCEPSDDLERKLDESPDPETSGLKPNTDQSDLSFPSVPSLSEDDDELTESKITAFLDEKALELKKMQTPLYEEFFNTLNTVCSPSFLERKADETSPNYLKLPPKSRSPSRVPVGTPSPSMAVDAVSSGSPGSNSKHVGNAGDQTSQENPSPQCNEAQQDACSPSSMSFSERQRKWKEELDQELERKREMMRQAGMGGKTSSPKILNRQRDRTRFASPGK